MESSLLFARIDDTAEICRRTNKCKYLGFLSREQAVAVKTYLEKRDVRFNLFGGYEDAQRVMLGCFPDWAQGDEFPITAVTLKYRKIDNISHRDVLGSLMGLGINRESVGDILIEEGRAVVFLTEDIVNFVLSQLEKVGRTGVTVSLGFEGYLPEGDKLTELSTTVASERLDCVVSALAGISRGIAVEKIIGGLVSVNSFINEKITYSVSAGDIITVRGKGKFIVSSLDGRTRKNRVILNYKKYI